jgi:hypothetical protein
VVSKLALFVPVAERTLLGAVLLRVGQGTDAGECVTVRGEVNAVEGDRAAHRDPAGPCGAEDGIIYIGVVLGGGRVPIGGGVVPSEIAGGICPGVDAGGGGRGGQGQADEAQRSEIEFPLHKASHADPQVRSHSRWFGCTRRWQNKKGIGDFSRWA